MVEQKETLSKQPINIEVIYAGGTISSLATPMGHREGGHVVDLVSRLREKNPDFGADVRLGKAEVAYTGLSENMDSRYWQAIDEKMSQALEKTPDAVLLTHGTDSMEQTARHIEGKFGTRLKTNRTKVILTGANEDLGHPKTDAWDNLQFTFESARSDAHSGTYVAFHRRLIPANLVVKEPYNGREMNFASSDDQGYREAIRAKHEWAEKTISRLKKVIPVDHSVDNRVLEYEVNTVRANHQELLYHLEEQKIKAILLVLYHSGTANTEEPELSVAKLVKQLREEYGIVSFGVSENGESIDLHSYETSVKLREAGVVPLYNMQREVALAKLSLVADGKPGEIIDKMLDNKVGEINNTSVIEEDIDGLKQLYR